jgi:NADH dehydrogenase [ubiquinone] 1 alpha subcomplex assembly factor 7
MTLPIPIDEFMRSAIRKYYQNNESVGASGDFITSPEISQMFGEIVGVWCATQYQEINSDFYLVEIGAGRGTMMKDILRATKRVPGFHDNLKGVIILENSTKLMEKQAQALHGYDVTWVDDISSLPAGNLIIVANEFLDALPIKQFERVGNIFYELGVGNARIAPVNLEYACPENGIIEVCPDALYIAEKLAERGNLSALFIDYGYYEPTYKSTLQAVKGHKYHDVFSDVGEADITAHVDFKAFRNIFSKHDIRTNYQTQREFLRNHGIELRANALIKNGANPATIIKALDRLTSPIQMGNLFKVLEVFNNAEGVS